ncbi:hypothetical protein PGTUg99_035843 [Puccinia graminis f. sp. tritici]|uniref:Uncharacterized protein n=1 Tax=Puccinia graminis f. sp. tritici TaxID=56615 RepID=A0A5B0SFJ5_PUCGR|nr:hypothetical protein PGTUg99_035843 [Puccinia graminis f. sp. tritici]
MNNFHHFIVAALATHQEQVSRVDQVMLRHKLIEIGDLAMIEANSSSFDRPSSLA